MTIYLYVKTHNKTGLKYLGKTTNKDPHKYSGSGGVWKSHLKEYGIDYITEVLQICKDNKELSYWGRYYSNLWNIVESNEWANQIPETGGGANHTEERKELFRQQQLGRKKPTRSKEHKQALSEATKGKPRPRSIEHRQALNNSIKKNWQNNDQRRQKTSETCRLRNLGNKQSPETIEKRRQAMKDYWIRKKPPLI